MNKIKIQCPKCGGFETIRNGFDKKNRQRIMCYGCISCSYLCEKDVVLSNNKNTQNTY